MQDNHPAQMYLLMGCLGAGKTTFIKKILTALHGQKYAVIQNQFTTQQMGIQQPLIVNQSGIPFSKFLELPNGCICCSAKNDLIASIEFILQNTQVRNILIETNGLADPAQVHYHDYMKSIKQFWFDQEMKINAHLHSVISLFPIHRWKQLSKQQLFQKQVIFSNKIILTFIDKGTQNQKQQLIQYIKTSNSNSLIKCNNELQLQPFMTNESIFELNDISLPINTSSSSSHSNIHSIFIKSNEEIANRNQFENHIGVLLWQSKMNIMRIKGIICVEKEDYVYELQGIEDTFELKNTFTHKNQYNQQSKILIIGHNLIEEHIRQILHMKT